MTDTFEQQHTFRYYGVFDATGKPTAFYNDDVYPAAENARNAAIPAAAVEISETEWRELLSDQTTARYVDGAVTYVDPPPPPPPPVNPLDALIARIAAVEAKLR